MRTILYICTGNTCRSPLAEAIARHCLDTGLVDGRDEIFVASAGVMASPGILPARETLEVLSRLGIEYEGRSVPLTPEMARKADLMFCMTRSHQRAVRDMLGVDAVDSVMLLDPEDDIDDPLGMGQSAYDSLANRLMTLIPQRLKEVFAT